MTAPVASAAPSRRRWSHGILYAAGALALLYLIAWLAIPRIVRSQLETRLTEALGRASTVESVVLDPLSLKLTVRNVAIADAAPAPPLLTLDELVADIASASIWHRAPVLDSLELKAPKIALSRDRAGRLNIQDLVDKALAAPPGPPPRFSLNNIEVDGGSVTFDDGLADRRHSLSDLAIAVPFASSLPYETQIDVTPRVAGTFNGSRFALEGTTTPFAERREATLSVDLDALPLPEYVTYLPVKPRHVLTGGALTTRLQVAFVEASPTERRLELRGDARLDGLALKRADGSALVGAERIVVVLDAIDVLGRSAKIASVTIEAPSMDVRRLADGTIELAQPLFDAPASPTRSREPSPPTAAPPWSASVAKLAVARGQVSFADLASTFRSALADVTLDVENLTTRRGDKAQVKVAFASADRIASFAGEAEIEPLVPAASGRFELAKFSLGLLFPYYKDALAVDVQKGSLDFASRFALDANGNLALGEGAATISDLVLALPGNRNPLWRVPSLAATGVDVDVAARKVAIASVTSRAPHLRIVRERDGSFEMTRIVKQTTGESAGSGPEWTVVAKSTQLDRVGIDFEDRAPSPAVRLAVRELDLAASELSNVRGSKAQLRIRARVGERGRLSFAGPVATQPVSLSGSVEASDVGLVALKPYVEPHVNVVLADGTLGVKGRIAVDVPDGAPARTTWKGDVSIQSFAALDKPTSSDLARWKSLRIEGLDVTNAPFKAAAARIALDDFYARVIIYPDATINLARLLTPGATPEPAPGAKPAAADAGAERRPLPLSIGRVDVARGNVNFSDLFVRPNYSANLTDVSGGISALSAEQAGDVAITARVDGTAPVEVQGRIQPFARELSIDLAGKARDIDLPPLTPYSVKYAGYGIEKGKLTFDVRYKVENRRLAAENRLVLDQLTFGAQRVESPTATKLPVLLAVSLLKDAKGVIDVKLPISGSLDDPKFSVGGLIIQVIVNLITKAITAPFALLSAAFGSGEELSTLDFAPGSAALAPETRKRVDTLGKALSDRPALKLDIGGRADPAADREALRQAALETALRREKMKSLAAAGNAPASLDQVTIASEERERWLAAAYRAAPLPDRPRNAIGMLKDVPAKDMEAMLVASAPVDDDSLRELANRRAQAVKDAIAAQGVDGERLFLVAPRLGEEAGGTRTPADAKPRDPSRVDLALR